MEETTAIFQLNKPISKKDALALHPMSLAFIGDAVQTLYTRTRVTVGATLKKTGALHHEVTQVVKAVAQAAEAEKLFPLFDEDEQDLFRRARNCKVQTSAKHAEPAEYRKASGFEAVLGYLYLTGNTTRLEEFLSACFEDNTAE
ncbi:MAG: Mini-ribonuclease 3 [Clostridia bacterium]|nr:Mini-ribonuclease 3 [Clostridia bacterium]